MNAEDITGGEWGIRLLIVEDEKPIRNGLVKHVHWEELGIDRIAAAANATEALQMLPQLRPDILLSDIRMPGMDGTKLAGLVRESLPDCQIIFISGYSDKEYLHAAISLGAIEYVEKPIDIAELEAVISRAVEAIHKNRRAHEYILHSLIHYPETTARAEEDETLWQHYVVFTIRSKDAMTSDVHAAADQLLMQLAQKGCPHCSALADKASAMNQVILVRSDVPWGEEQIGQACRILVSLAGEKEQWFVAASGEWSGRAHVSEAWRESTQALRHLSWKGWGGWALSAEKSTDYRGALSEEEERDFYKLITDGMEEDAVLWLNRQFHALIEQHAEMNFHVRSLFHTMDQVVVRACVAQPGVLQPPFSDKIPDDSHAVQTIEELRDIVRQHIHQAQILIKGGTKVNYQVRQVCDYIQEHLGDKDLSLGQLAETVYLTPTYLSSLFSRNMGMTIGQYITEARIQKAAQLLKDSQYKQYQIAEMVGYDDPKYFARLFKKKMGMSPAEYRDSL